jgi:E3 ubiquitin-protein ligase HUWE1
LNEHSSAPLLKALLAHARAALTEIKDFWHFAPSDESPFDTAAVQARIDEMLSPGTAEALTSANEVFRRLVKSQLILAILSELHSMDTYMSRQPSTQLLANLKSADDSKLIHDFCAIYRACILSHVCLKAQLPESSKAKSLLTPIVAQVEASAMETDSGPSSTQLPQTVAPEGTGSEPEKDKAVDWPDNKLKNAKALKQVFTAIPEAIKTFLQGVMTIHNSRRSAIDTQQRKDATYIANAIALGVAQNLRWPSTPKASVNFEYSTLMAKFMADLLTSERSSVAGLHLIFLKALDKHQGIPRLIDLLGRYSEEAAELTLIPEGDRDSGARLRLIHAVGGLKVVLGVFDTITGHKTLLSPGHLLLLTQDSKSPSFFDPNAFLVKLRARVLPAVNEIWKSDFLGPSPPIIVRAVFRIILHILESQGENSETVSTTPFPTGLPSRVQAQPNQEHVISLMEMGFPRQACEQALIRRMNNLATAADYLMSHPDVVAAARTREAAQTAAAAAAAPAPTTPMGETASDAMGGPTSANAQSSTPPVPATPLEVDMTDHASDVPEVTASVMEEGAADSTEAATSDKGKEPAKRYSKADLDIQRDAVKSSFIDRSLTLSQDHGELVFDIRDALKTIEFKNSSGIYDASRGLEGILQALNALIQNSGDSPLAREKGIAVRVRLVALIFSDPSFRRAADAVHEKYMAPVDILVQEYFQGSYTAETRPKWLASIMLLAEMILARSELPYDPRVAANLTMEEDEDFTADVSKQPVLRGPAFSESRETLFEVCLHVLQNGLKDRAEFQSAMRLLIFLTRRFEVARKFVERGGLRALMSTYDGNHKSDNNFQLFALLILRHSVEDKETLKSLMSLHIGSWLSKASHRNNADVGSYGRDLVADAYRDTDAFMEVTQELCQLGDGPIGEIMTKRKAEQSAQEASLEDKATEVPIKDDEEMTVEDPGKTPSKPLTASVEIENVLHFLIEQAHSATAQVLSPSRDPVATGTEAHVPQDTPATAAELPPSSDTASAVPVKDVAKASVPPSIKEYTYASFYLTCLYELVTSYMPCKYALLSYKRKGNELASGTPGPSTASKAGKGRFFLGYLLSDVIPTNSLVPDATSESRKRFALSSQAIGVLIALCSEVQRKSSDTKEEPSPEITLVRKTVLDAVAKAFKDAASIPESMNAKYGRLSSLSSLCSRLLAPPVAPGGPTMTTAERSHTDLSIQMAKLMLEKNFAALLTNSLSDIDLNYPSVQVLINAILSPLELLTKLVTKISRTVDGDSGSIAQAPQPEPVMLEEDSASEEGDMEEADIDMEEDGDVDIQGEGDETMDVYRNSALGMFEGQLEPANAEEQYMSSEEVEQEMEEWGNEDDLMDEEGVVPR